MRVLYYPYTSGQDGNTEIENQNKDRVPVITSKFWDYEAVIFKLEL